jgi:hypothetical protein
VIRLRMIWCKLSGEYRAVPSLLGRIRAGILLTTTCFSLRSGTATSSRRYRASLRTTFALDAEGGRGLFLVETLSERWGWYPTRNPDGKVTWCEVGWNEKEELAHAHHANVQVPLAAGPDR